MNSLSNEIIQLLNQQNDAAFEVVFSIYYPRLVYFAKEYVSYEEARNLVQDAFISYWEKNPELQNEAQLQGYLYTVVKNNCLMRLRHEKIKKLHVQQTERRNQNEVYLSALEQLDTSDTTFHEIEAIFEKTLAGLPPRCREVFVLSRIEGQKNQEIAKELNISLKAVEAHITKAIKIYRIALKDYLPLAGFVFISTC